MLARLVHSFLHLFTPRLTNNHRPKIFHPKSLAVLAAVIVGLNSGIRPLSGFSGGVLGYASDIQVFQVLEQINRQRLEAGLTELKLIRPAMITVMPVKIWPGIFPPLL